MTAATAPRAAAGEGRPPKSTARDGKKLDGETAKMLDDPMIRERLANEGNGQVGTVNAREVPAYRLKFTPFSGNKDSRPGHKEVVQEAMKSFTNVKTYSLPWV